MADAPRAIAPYLSKTDFTNFLHCAGYAWLAKHQPELLHRDLAPWERRVIANGLLVQQHARDWFAPGRLIDTRNPIEAVQLTEEALAAADDVLFEATVRAPTGLLARVDILVRTGRSWSLYEVKSTSNSDRLARDYLADVAFQTLAFTDAGFDVTEVSIIHLDPDYRRGEGLELDKVFRLESMTTSVEHVLDETVREVDRALYAVMDAETRAICACHRSTRSRRCVAFAHFHPQVPERGTIYHLAGIHQSKLEQALDLDVLHLVDWPDEIVLSERQQRQVSVARSGEEIVDAEAIVALMKTWTYPLQFIDYETFTMPISSFPGYGPYATVPFQYSLHTVHADGEIEHREFLCEARGEDPSRSLLVQLQRDILPEGTVVSWNAPYEKRVNGGLASRYSEASAFLDDMNARTEDLAEIVRRGWWMHPDFDGSWSIKNVLPVAAPGLTYDGLEIGAGDQASAMWVQCMIEDDETMADDEREQLFAALRAYCTLDTLGMVQIWQHVRGLAGLV